MTTTTPTPLIVPIQLDALMLASLDASATVFAPPYANFRDMASRTTQVANVGNNLLNQPFQGSHSMMPGVHLHWHLPRALRTADYGDGKSAMTVPSAPNRWLVVRTVVTGATTQTPTVAATGWVIESDYVDTAADYSGTLIPHTEDADQPFRYIGRVYDAASWPGETDSAKHRPATPLTAVGFGIPDFSSSYQNCTNVFGMLDAGINSVTFDHNTDLLLYSVTGWYSTTTLDPLAASADAAATAKQFGWACPTGNLVPSATLCHGMVYKLPWQAQGSFLNGNGGPLGCDVAVGNTPAEAFAAFAAAVAKMPDAEPLLNALQLGVLPILQQTGGAARMEEAIYNAGFQSVDGGREWRIKTGSRDKKKRPAPVPAGLAQSVAALNALQAADAQLSAEIASLQTRIFDDWYRFILGNYSTPQPSSPTVPDMYAFIGAEVTALQALQAQHKDLAPLLAQQEATVRTALPEDLLLVSAPATRYSAPRNPVIVLGGDGVPLPLPEDDPAIGCIFAPAVVPSIDLAAGVVAGSSAVSLAASALWTMTVSGSLPAASAAMLATAIGLAQTDLLLLPQASNLVTLQLQAQSGTGNPAVLDFTGTAQAIDTAQTNWLAAQPLPALITFTPVAPLPQADIAAVAWSMPWQPIALSWAASYAPWNPLQGPTAPYAADLITAGYGFDTATSLNLEPKTTPSGNLISIPLSGTILLATDASTSLQSQIQAYLAQHPDEELSDVLSQLSGVPSMSQALGGFNRGLLQLIDTLQLPVSDPASQDPVYGPFSDETVHDAVGDMNRIAPDMSGGADTSDPVYNAVRMGTFTLTRLRLVDRFGRFRDVTLDQVAFSYMLSAGETPTSCVLPLRLTEPTRLRVTTLSAEDPYTPDCGIPQSSPICGWVVPNVLSGGLMYYDAGGSAIGSHIAVQDKLIWQVAPGVGAVGEVFGTSFQGRNPTLTAFATAVETAGVHYAKGMLHAFLRGRTFIAPSAAQQSRQTAMLIGTPLALVQADLAMDRFGLPTPEQTYAAMAIDCNNTTNPLVRTTHGVTAVSVPVTLGDQTDLDDGLIGFFLSQQGLEVDFTTFYSAQADGTSKQVVTPQFSTVQVTAGTGPSCRVAMLMDPRAGVHVNTGLMPVQRLTLAPETYGAALGGMSFTFLTAPLLAPAGALAMPTPKESDRAWGWVAHDGRQWQSQRIAPPSQAATSQRPHSLQEGWLKLTPSKEPV